MGLGCVRVVDPDEDVSRVGRKFAVREPLNVATRAYCWLKQRFVKLRDCTLLEGHLICMGRFSPDYGGVHKNT